mgnify:CR=1 FL=1
MAFWADRTADQINFEARKKQRKIYEQQEYQERVKYELEKSIKDKLKNDSKEQQKKPETIKQTNTTNKYC